MFRYKRSTEARPLGLRAAWLAGLALCLAACQPQPAERLAPTDVNQSGLEEKEYLAAAQAGLPVYRIDPEASRIVCVVRREGPLARFGHDHAIGARQLDGLLLWAPDSPERSRGEIVIQVADLEVDPPDLRAEQQLDTKPDEAAIAGTRNNLVNHVLLAEQWSEIRMGLMLLESNGPGHRLAVDLSLNGVTRRLETDVQVTIVGDQLKSEGSLTLKQSDWGIEPFSVLGGGLRVSDQVVVHYRLRARVWNPSILQMP